MSSITFVSSIFHLSKKYYEHDKPLDWRIERFQELASTGIQICLFCCSSMKQILEPILVDFPNVCLMDCVEIEELQIMKYVQENGLKIDAGEQEEVSGGLPKIRNMNKDILEYLCIINNKPEFLYKSIQKNPFHSTHFAWIDFNITHVFKKLKTSLDIITQISQNTFGESCFWIPGCWDKNKTDHNYDSILEKICWRFCGGFFLGDKNSIENFCLLYFQQFPQFLKTNGLIVWEVNFWAWLEHNLDELNKDKIWWSPEWFEADHNDSIIDIPTKAFAKPLMNSTKIEYEYPEIENFKPSSASYLYHNNTHYLCTRYVNYFNDPSGMYFYYNNHSVGVIRNITMLSVLTPQNGILKPEKHMVLNENLNLVEHPYYSRGVEDVRIYAFKDKIKFIGTTVGFHHTGGNRMLTGICDIEKNELIQGKMICSPFDCWHEKNWIPLIIEDTKTPFVGRELFIYSWSPFQVGEINYDKTLPVAPQHPESQYAQENLEHDFTIIVKHELTTNTPFFHKVRGSTRFVELPQYLLGVVHFSESKSPRNYFHLLVALDKHTLKPLKYSSPFYFEKPLIEFCIGFTIRDGKYLFWISRYDRDPVLITVGMNQIPIDLNFIDTV